MANEQLKDILKEAIYPSHAVVGESENKPLEILLRGYDKEDIDRIFKVFIPTLVEAMYDYIDYEMKLIEEVDFQLELCAEKLRYCDHFEFDNNFGIACFRKGKKIAIVEEDVLFDAINELVAKKNNTGPTFGNVNGMLSNTIKERQKTRSWRNVKTVGFHQVSKFFGIHFIR